MVKVVVLLVKRSDLDTETFRRYYRETHGPIAAKLPGLRGYVQNYAVSSLGPPPSYDGITELWFDSAEAVQAAFTSPEGQAVFADLPNFLDSTSVRRMLAEQATIVPVTGEQTPEAALDAIQRENVE